MEDDDITRSIQLVGNTDSIKAQRVMSSSVTRIEEIQAGKNATSKECEPFKREQDIQSVPKNIFNQ